VAAVSERIWSHVPDGLLRVKSRIGESYRPLQKRAGALVFDRRIDTVDTVPREQLGFHDNRMGAYEVSGWFLLRRGLQGYAVTRDDVFVDFGSGKGRIIYQAARRPFGRVVGIELAEQLNEIARRNVERNRRRLRCQNIELITGDFGTTPIPDDMTVAYAFNPVWGELFQQLMQNIVASLERRPRRVRFIYANPVEAAEVVRSGHFQLARRSWGIRRDLDPWIHVYETVTR
jgi:protein-L-isoaspartate O-methyltransferase